MSEGRENHVLYIYILQLHLHIGLAISLHMNNNFVSKNKKKDNWLNYFYSVFLYLNILLLVLQNFLSCDGNL